LDIPEIFYSSLYKHIPDGAGRMKISKRNGANKRLCRFE
jgi:hypothetical protein